MSRKNYAVIARFDHSTDEKLTKLTKHLLGYNDIDAYSEWPPHITLSAYEGVDIDTLLDWTGEFADKHSAFDISLSSLGVFPPGGQHTETAVLYVSPAQSRELIDFYYAFHERLDEFCGGLGWLYSAKFGYPAIHATIGIFKVAEMQGAMEEIFRAGIFGMAKITALEVYTYPMELIRRFDLK